MTTTDQSAHLRDLILSVALIGLSLVLLWSAGDLPPARYEPLGARFMAHLMPFAVLLLAILLGARTAWRMKHDKPAAGSAAFTLRAARVVALCFVLLGIYIFMLQERIDYRISSILFVAACALVLVGRPTAKQAIVIAAVALVASFGTFHVMTELLNVRLP